MIKFLLIVVAVYLILKAKRNAQPAAKKQKITVSFDPRQSPRLQDGRYDYVILLDPEALFDLSSICPDKISPTIIVNTYRGGGNTWFLSSDTGTRVTGLVDDLKNVNVAWTNGDGNILCEAFNVQQLPVEDRSVEQLKRTYSNILRVGFGSTSYMYDGKEWKETKYNYSVQSWLKDIGE